MAFKGYKTEDAALRAARIATTDPRAIELVSGWVGTGDVVMRGNGPDQCCYGPRGTHAWLSDLADAGLVKGL